MRKVEFYEKRHNLRVKRKIVISPMVEPEALRIAKDLNIEVYSYAEEVPLSFHELKEEKEK